MLLDLGRILQVTVIERIQIVAVVAAQLGVRPQTLHAFEFDSVFHGMDLAVFAEKKAIPAPIRFKLKFETSTDWNPLPAAAIRVHAHVEQVRFHAMVTCF
ncbi:hypothetical protein TspCOW1_07680 [Thiohalobacter sp. COW1]|nr:hypothetical protein TspCOW1_07680 [Thiohalobacter sp. COW1]